MNKKALEILINKGYTLDNLADKYNKSQSSIRYWLGKFGLKTKALEIQKIKLVEEIKEKSKLSSNMTELTEKLGRARTGNSLQNLKALIKQFNIDISHFSNKPRKSFKIDYLKPKDILVYDRGSNGRRDKTELIRKALKEEGVDSSICSICGLKDKWNGKELVFQIDHIDGDRLNNIIDNLRFICPNCHSQTLTYCRGIDSKSYFRDKEREKNKGLTDAQLKYYKSRRKTERPPQKQLLKEIEELGYVGTGKKYGVSDNAIRKWKKFYEK